MRLLEHDEESLLAMIIIPPSRDRKLSLGEAKGGPLVRDVSIVLEGHRFD